MSEALERVPILALVPHMRVTRPLEDLIQQAAPGTSRYTAFAFIVDLFGYEHGVRVLPYPSCLKGGVAKDNVSLMFDIERHGHVARTRSWAEFVEGMCAEL